MSSANSIKVVARFRPQNKIELASGGQPIVTFHGEDTCALDSREAQGSFTFDRVFDMACKQQDIFDFSIRSTVDDILNGYNGTVFAYGQTGAGKSYTMYGTDPTFKCLSPDTMVRTTEGDKPIEAITVGTKLFGIDDLPVLCIKTGDIQDSSTMRTIKHRVWNSLREEASFECTSDHILALQARGVKPYLRAHKKETERRRLIWHTRCDRTELIEEASSLQWDTMLHQLYTELSQKLERRPTDSEAHDFIDSGLDDFSTADPLPSVDSSSDFSYHHAFNLFKSSIPPAEVETIDDDDIIQLFRARLHACMDEHLEHLMPEQDEIPDNDEPDLTVDLDDFVKAPEEAGTPRKFRKVARFPSSIHASDPSWRASTAMPSSPAANPNESQAEAAPEQDIVHDSQSSFFADTEQVVRNEDHLQKFAVVREQLNPKCSHAGGPCKAYKTVSVNFANEAQARLALDLLSGDHYRVVDPYAIQNGDLFTMTVDEFNTSCQGTLAKSKRSLKLFRTPLRFMPSNAPPSSLPIDPYFLGFWLGDGAKGSPSVVSSDLEIKSYLQAMVDRLNKDRPDDAAPLHITEHVKVRAGDEWNIDGRTGTHKVTCYDWWIASPSPTRRWNPVRDGLAELGFMVQDKLVGIPDIYMESDEDARLAVLAGLIESDGTYVGDSNGGMYVFTQGTEEHKKIVVDARKLALSCGIQCCPITETTTAAGSPKYRFAMTRGCEKFQHHLLLPRKKMGNARFSDRVTTDTHNFEVSEPHEGKYRPIEVSGGFFQLSDRTVVHNCTSEIRNIDDDEGRGVIPRIVEQIFASIMSSPGTIEYTVRVSYMEIYMERIRDLLAPQNDNLPVHEEKNRGVYVKGLLEIYVSSVQEVYEVMRRGGNARAVAATNMNQESSRSHSIFVITITQKNVETGSAKSGQLFLVDLAGSEKVGKTGASGQTLEEAKKINKSLSALGMVINALTDGKSSHIPYRDSKLTRILQESLGGNSRTTLIINCSPSSYNDAETLSTLRFGTRAKSIKNKAKVNAELSPAELKALLKKAQGQVTNFESYISNLEGEIQLWRAGESVPKERWVTSMVPDGVARTKADARTPRPSTPSQLVAESRSETPALSERAGTPSLPLEKDEREEFLRRENELQDQISEKESQAAAAEKQLRETKEELAYLKEHDAKVGKENEKLTTEVNEFRMQLERLNFESKEAQISMDAMKEANNELTTELDEVKQQLLDVKMSAKETGAALDEKEKKKAEKMAKMMAGFDLGGDVFSDNERQIAETIQRVDALHEQASIGDNIAPDEFKTLRQRLIETQGIVRQAELSMYSSSASDLDSRRRQELEARLEAVQQEYEEILTRNLTDADVEEVKARLENAFANRQTAQIQLVDDLKLDITQKAAENTRMKTLIDELQQRVKAGNAAPMANGKTIQQQIAEFDVMKKSLMRDLQNRCERVVELEISLDETREQYNNVLRSSNNRAQQKKMAFLERNLEQLTQVQRQLVEQNSALKKEVAIAERKLIARNERIQSLESLLQDSQEKMAAANHKFEVQLAAVKERLEAAKAGSTRGLNAPGGFSFASAGSRIAKPLRGGGGGNDAPPTVPTIQNLHQTESNSSNKRASWFFNKS